MKVATAYGATDLPTIVVLDRQGAIVALRTGVVDAISYEGAMTSVNLGSPYGTVSLVTGTTISEADGGVGTDSLARIVDGVDTGDDDVDWALTTTATPGSANVITP